MILDPSYGSKTLDELQAEFVQLGNDLSTIDAKRRAILSLMNKRKAELLAQFKTSDLTDVEKEALRQALFAKGIIV
jgi:hypothetical protein